MKLIRLLASVILVVALLAAFVWPLYMAHEANTGSPKTSRPARKHSVKLAPGMVMRLTLVRFTVPPSKVFTPPVLPKGAVLPKNMLKFYRDAAQSQGVSPLLRVFRPILIRDGQTKGVLVRDTLTPLLIRDNVNATANNPPGKPLAHILNFIPAIRVGGFAAVNVQAEEISPPDNSANDAPLPSTVKTVARASVKLYPAHTIRLPKSFDNKLGNGIFFLTLTVPPAAPVKPYGEVRPPSAIPAVPIANSFVHVQITDFDIAADMVPSVTHAMLNPVQRKARLLAISQAADSQSRPFVITPGLSALDDPAKPHTFVAPIPSKLGPFATTQADFDVPESHYLLHQTLHLASRVNPDGTAAADIILSEQPAKLPGDFLYPTRLIGNSQTRAFVNINGPRTVLLAGPTGAGGIVHLIFATFTLAPPKP